MVLRLTSAKVTQAPDPRDEQFVRGDERNAHPDKRSPRATREGAAGSRELGSQKKVAADVALDLVLPEIVQQARLTTTATGAFIGLVEGHKIVCQATSGSNAGEFVAYLNRDRRVVDICLRTFDVHICRDSENSKELDGSACRHLGARSVVIVPILDETEKKLGIFGIFSPQADAFSNADIVALQSLSSRIADAMAQVDRFTSASGNAPTLRLDLDKSLTSGDKRFSTALPSLAAVKGPAVWVTGILVVVLLMGWTVSRAISQGAMYASTKVPELITSQAVSNSSAQQPSSGQLSSGQLSSDKAAANSNQSPAAAAVVKPSPATASRPAPVIDAFVAPVAMKNNTAAKKVPPRSGLHVPDLEIENALDDASGSLPPESVNTSSSNTRKSPAQPRTGATAVSAGPPPREAVHFTRDPEPMRTDATPPSSGAAQNASPTNIGSLLGGPVMISEDTALQRLVERVKPEYPEEAKADHAPEAVIVDVVVGKDGQVQGVTPVNGDARLLASAAKAVAKWQFAPLLRDGHFVSFESHITVHFASP